MDCHFLERPSFATTIRRKSTVYQFPIRNVSTVNRSTNRSWRPTTPSSATKRTLSGRWATTIPALSGLWLKWLKLWCHLLLSGLRKWSIKSSENQLGSSRPMWWMLSSDRREFTEPIISRVKYCGNCVVVSQNVECLNWLILLTSPRCPVQTKGNVFF